MWSPSFKDFLKQSTEVEIDKRPTAIELLEVNLSFIYNSGKGEKKNNQNCFCLFEIASLSPLRLPKRAHGDHHWQVEEVILNNLPQRN